MPTKKGKHGAVQATISKGSEVPVKPLEALRQMVSMDKERNGLSDKKARLNKEVLALSCEIFEAIKKYARSENKQLFSQLSGLSLISGELALDGEELTGCLVASADSGSRQSGIKIHFISPIFSPAKVKEAHANPIGPLIMPKGESRFMITVISKPSGKCSASLKRAYSLASEVEDSQRKLVKFWGGQPADFQLYWAAALLEHIELPLSKLPKNSAKCLMGQFKQALKDRSILIETEFDSDGSPHYFLDLPSFSIAFAMSPKGEPTVEKISQTQRMLIWSKREIIYKKE